MSVVIYRDTFVHAAGQAFTNDSSKPVLLI
jgi:hypothetical protein